MTWVTVCWANRAAATWHARSDRPATPHLPGCCSAVRRSRQPWAGTVQEIIDLLKKEYPGSETAVAADVLEAIELLVSEGALLARVV